MKRSLFAVLPFLLMFAFSSQAAEPSIDSQLQILKKDLHLKSYQMSNWQAWSQSMRELGHVNIVTKDDFKSADPLDVIDHQLAVLSDFETRGHYALARTRLFLGDLDKHQQELIRDFTTRHMPHFETLPHSQPLNQEDVVGVTGCDRHCVK